jgi:hypothetical protein
MARQSREASTAPLTNQRPVGPQYGTLAGLTVYAVPQALAATIPSVAYFPESHPSASVALSEAKTEMAR